MNKKLLVIAFLAMFSLSVLADDPGDMPGGNRSSDPPPGNSSAARTSNTDYSAQLAAYAAYLLSLLHLK